MPKNINNEMTDLQKLDLLSDTYVCQCCEWHGTQFDNDIPDLWERVDPGEIMPAGTCPECGAVVHGLLDGLIIVDPESGTYYTATYGLEVRMINLQELDSEPLKYLPPKTLARLLKRYQEYLPDGQAA